MRVGRGPDVDEALPGRGRPAAPLVDVRVRHQEVRRPGRPRLQRVRHAVGVLAHRRPPGARVQAHAEDQERAVHPVQRTAARGRARQRSAELAQLDEEQLRPRPRAGGRDQRLDRSLGQVGEQDAVGVDRCRRLRVELQVARRRRRTLVEGVDLRAAAPAAARAPASAASLPASTTASMIDELPTPDVGRQPRLVGRLEAAGRRW